MAGFSAAGLPESLRRLLNPERDGETARVEDGGRGGKYRGNTRDLNAVTRHSRVFHNQQQQSTINNSVNIHHSLHQINYCSVIKHLRSRGTPAMKLSTTRMLSSVTDSPSRAPAHSRKNIAAARRISSRPRWMPRHCLAPYPNGLNASLACSVIPESRSQRV